MKKLTALVMALALCLGLAACSGAPAASPTPDAAATPPVDAAATPAVEPAAPAVDLNVGVFYYTFADTYITSVRANMDEKLTALGVKFQNFDGNSSQPTQTDQITTAISNGVNLLIVNIVETSSPDAAQGAVDAAKAAGIPIIFFNREVANEVVTSYDQCAFVGTDAPEAGHMQGKMVGEYVVANFDAMDLNKDGKISYVMFKGQEGNAEAEARTQFGVEDADAVITAAGKAALEFYDSKNTAKYLVDQTGNWSAQASADYMSTILGEYTEANGNMIELVIANNDGMAEGAITTLQGKGYNKGEGSVAIPVFGVDATDSAKALIDQGFMTGTVKQDAVGMADTICALVANAMGGSNIMDGIADRYTILESDRNADGSVMVAKIRVAYGIYDAANK